MIGLACVLGKRTVYSFSQIVTAQTANNSVTPGVKVSIVTAIYTVSRVEQPTTKYLAPELPLQSHQIVVTTTRILT